MSEVFSDITTCLQAPNRAAKFVRSLRPRALLANYMSPQGLGLWDFNLRPKQLKFCCAVAGYSGRSAACDSKQAQTRVPPPAGSRYRRNRNMSLSAAGVLAHSGACLIYPIARCGDGGLCALTGTADTIRSHRPGRRPGGPRPGRENPISQKLVSGRQGRRSVGGGMTS